MTRQTEPRRAAVRFCLLAIGLFACLFAWVALLSHSVADLPARVVAPPNDPPANWCGTLGAYAAHYLFHYFGLGSYVLVGLLSGGVYAGYRDWNPSHAWLRLVGVLLTAAACSALASIFLPLGEAWPMRGPGGMIGTAIEMILLPPLSLPGTLLVIGTSILIGLIVAADEAFLRLVRWSAEITIASGPVMARAGRDALASAGAAAGAAVDAVASGVTQATGRLAPATATAGAGRRKPAELDEEEDEDEYEYVDVEEDEEPEDDEYEYEYVDVDDDEGEEEDEDDEYEYEYVDEEEDEEEEAEVPVAKAPPAAPPPVARREVPVERVPDPPRPKPVPRPKPPVGDYVLPPMSILDDPEPIDKSAIEMLCREKALILEQTLNEFRLEVKVASIETGPVITVFELRLSPGIKVSQVQALTNDMARALKAPAVRVVAPLPGRNTIGIEVPNLDKEKVRIKDLMQMAGRKTETYGVPLYLGKDASGQALVSDLTRMPHLLIAGTTGSGKSVCVSSIILSILLVRSPDEVQLILVDPKVVELSMFKDIPHLMCPIVTEMSKAEGILDWATTKMDERYALLAEAGVKDIVSYNKLGPDGLRERMGIEDDEEFARIPVHMSYIVIVIDELADLMMTSAKEVEFHLCRLAQKSRAVGIHLIVSTQRPQANVVTGLIKSNLPSRIAFRVSSKLDSRIVLDQNGGEVLMGQGDMLFLPPGQSKLVRAQGAFVADDELRGIVKHTKGQREQSFDAQLMRMPSAGQSTGERDELFDQAVEHIIASGRGSVSLLQRKLTIGYGRASRLIDQMYEAGIVGEYKGSQAREVNLTLEEWTALRDARDREEEAAADEFNWEG